MSRRAKRPAPAPRAYPKLKLSPAKDAFHSTALRQQTTTTTTGISTRQSPPPPPPSTALQAPAAPLLAVTAQPAAKRQRVEEPHSTPTAARLTFTTVPVAVSQRQQQRFAASSAAAQVAASSTAADAVASGALATSGTTAPASNSLLQSGGAPSWDPTADPDLLDDLEWPEEEELLLPSYRFKPSHRAPHVSRMTLHLTSTNNSANNSHAISSTQPSQTQLTQPARSDQSGPQMHVRVSLLRDVASASSLDAERKDASSDDHPMDTSELQFDAVTDNLASISSGETTAAAALAPPLPSSVDPPQVSPLPVSPTSPFAPPGLPPAPSSSFGFGRPPRATTFSQIPLSAVTEGEENEDDESTRPSRSPSAVGEQGDPTSGGRISRTSSLLQLPDRASSVVAVTDASLPRSSSSALPSSQAAPPSSSQPSSSQQPLSSQQSVGSVSLPFWADDNPSLAYLYSDFPDTGDVHAGGTSADQEEEEFQHQFQDEMEAERHAHVAGRQARRASQASPSSQMATQVLGAATSPTQAGAAISPTQVFPASAYNRPPSPTQVLASTPPAPAAASESPA